MSLVKCAGGNVDGEVLCGAAVVRAASGWHVMVVATDGNFDVVIVDHEVVGRIETTPAVSRRKHFDPGV